MTIEVKNGGTSPGDGRGFFCAAKNYGIWAQGGSGKEGCIV